MPPKSTIRRKLTALRRRQVRSASFNQRPIPNPAGIADAAGLVAALVAGPGQADRLGGTIAEIGYNGAGVLR
jgi:hypothetical protein